MPATPSDVRPTSTGTDTDTTTNTNALPEPTTRRPLFTITRIALLALSILFATISFFYFDRPLTNSVNDHIPTNSPTSRFFSQITNLGLADYYLYSTAFLAILCFFFKDRAWKLSRNDLPDSPRNPVAFVFHRIRFSPLTTRFSLAFISIAGSGILINIIKVIIGRYRPSPFLDHNNDPAYYGFVPFSVGYDVNSMPSGHATVCGALGALLCLNFPKARFLWIPLTLFGASTRILTESHYLSDTVVGFTIGALFTVILHDFAKNHSWPANPPI